MKSIATAILATATLFTLSYLIGSFCEASFSIVEWHSITRFMVGVIGGVISIAMGLELAGRTIQEDRLP